MRKLVLGTILSFAAGVAAAQGVTITGWAAPGMAPPPAPTSPAPVPTAELPSWAVTVTEPPPAAAPAPAPLATGAAPRRWLRLSGAPSVVEGSVIEGQELAGAPVLPVVTGQMRVAPSRLGGVLSGITKLQPGPVYAVRLGGKVTWCAPQRGAGKDGRGYWWADCFHPDTLWGPHIYTHARGEGLFVTRAKVSQNGVTAPAITEGPVDFGVPIRLAYVLGKQGKRDVELRIEIQAEASKSVFWTTSRRWAEDGTAQLEVFDGEIRLVREGPKAVRVEVIKAPSAQATSPA